MRAPLNTIPYDGPISYDQEWEQSVPVHTAGEATVDQTGERAITDADRLAVTSVYTAEQRARALRASMDSSLDLDGERGESQGGATGNALDAYDYAGEESYQRSIPRPDDVLQVALGSNDVRFVRRAQVEEAYFQGILHESTLVLEPASERWRTLQAMIAGGTTATWQFPSDAPEAPFSQYPGGTPESPPSTVRPVLRPPPPSRSSSVQPPPLPLPRTALRPPPVPNLAVVAPPPLPWERHDGSRFESRTQSGIISTPRASSSTPPPPLPPAVSGDRSLHGMMLPPVPNEPAPPQLEIVPLAPPFARRIGPPTPPPPPPRQSGLLPPPPRLSPPPALTANTPVPPRPLYLSAALYSSAAQGVAPRGVAPRGSSAALYSSAAQGVAPRGVAEQGVAAPYSLAAQGVAAQGGAARGSLAYAPPHYPGQDAVGTHESFPRAKSALAAVTGGRARRVGATPHEREWAEAVRANQGPGRGVRSWAWAAMLLASGFVLHRQGVLYDWSKELGLGSVYTSAERALVGGPAHGDDHGLSSWLKRRQRVSTGRLDVVTTVAARPQDASRTQPTVDDTLASAPAPAVASAAVRPSVSVRLAQGEAAEPASVRPAGNQKQPLDDSSPVKPRQFQPETVAAAAAATPSSKAEAWLQSPNPYETASAPRRAARRTAGRAASKTTPASADSRRASRPRAEAQAPDNAAVPARSAPVNDLHAAMRAAVGK